MIASKPLNSLERNQLVKFRKGLSSLLVTRWIYLSFSILSSIGTIFLTIFLGTFVDWLFPNDTLGQSGLTNGIFAFGFVILSIPRFIGNIMYIVQLRTTAQVYQDAFFMRAYKKQILRVVCYLLMIIFLISLLSIIIDELTYYTRFRSYGALITAVGRFTSLYEVTPGMVFLVILFGLVSFIEKILNVMTWHEIQEWFKMQQNVVKDNVSQKTDLDYIILGSEYIKIGNIITFFEGTVGNFVYNVGLYKMYKGLFRITPKLKTININKQVVESRYNPKPSYTYRRNYQTQKVVERRYTASDAASQTVSKPMKSRYIQKTQVQDVKRTGLNFCGYCGSKIEYKDAIFCIGCGNRL